MHPEYLELPEPEDPTDNFSVSVVLHGGAFISKREISLVGFLKLISGQQYEMTFDKHPYEITRFDVDMVKYLVKIYARPML
jgi:predicted site-specific integrase-resolvase